MVYRYGPFRWFPHLGLSFSALASDALGRQFASLAPLFAAFTVGAIALALLALIRDLMSPTELILGTQRLTLRWLWRQEQIAFLVISVIEERTWAYPPRRAWICYGSTRTQVKSNLVGYERFLTELDQRTRAALGNG